MLLVGLWHINSIANSFLAWASRCNFVGCLEIGQMGKHLVNVFVTQKKEGLKNKIKKDFMDKQTATKFQAKIHEILSSFFFFQFLVRRSTHKKQRCPLPTFSLIYMHAIIMTHTQKCNKEYQMDHRNLGKYAHSGSYSYFPNTTTTTATLRHK